MKEGLFIKLNWLVYKRAILNNLAILSKENSKELYKEARKVYKREMKQLPEYGDNDTLKLNLAHGILIYAIYESCEQKPGVNELRKFYHGVILSSKIVRLLFANTDMTCDKRIKNEINQAARSEKATL